MFTHIYMYINYVSIHYINIDIIWSITYSDRGQDWPCSFTWMIKWILVYSSRVRTQNHWVSWTSLHHHPLPSFDSVVYPSIFLLKKQKVFWNGKLLLLFILMEEGGPHSIYPSHLLVSVICLLLVKYKVLPPRRLKMHTQKCIIPPQSWVKFPEMCSELFTCKHQHFTSKTGWHEINDINNLTNFPEMRPLSLQFKYLKSCLNFFHGEELLIGNHYSACDSACALWK